MTGRRRQKKERRERLRQEQAARFSALCAAQRAAGKRGKEAVFSARAASLWGALAWAPFAAAFIALYVLFAPCASLLSGNVAAELLLLAAALLVLVPLHEGVHALVAAAVHGSFEGIRVRLFGMPSCVCLRASNRAQYAACALAPFVLLGLAPAAAGVCTGCLAALLFGLFGILAAGADLLVAVRAVGAGKGAVLIDHPECCGAMIYLPDGQKNS